MDLGIVEGFYGPAWTWEERRHVVAASAKAGYGAYLYAPKADPFLRRRWQEPYPEEQARALAAFVRFCDDRGVSFGVGLSPYDAFRNFDGQARLALKEKLRFLNGAGVRRLALLFDDMDGGIEDLAVRQAEIVQYARLHTDAEKLVVCPTYYSDDAVLDRVFGRRPERYLEDLGEALDADIGIFWTGEEVCSREVSPGHLDRVGQLLGRKPVLWDNYPVNDGSRMSCHLHLRGFTGRPAANARWLDGHFINPALQPTLTLIPALTLAKSYRLGHRYEYGAAFREAATEVLGVTLGNQVAADLLALQDGGLGRMDNRRREELQERYRKHDHAGAREIVRWLSGEYQVTDETVQTQ